MADQSKTYTYGIKKILLDNIDSAKKSIFIAMAWFTDNEIKDCLIEKKKQIPRLIIEIVVDPNEINEKHFLDYKQKFEQAGITIKKKEVRKFLHHKFMLIDGIITITGSYNYSKKAQMNLELIEWKKSKKAHRKLEKEFRFITDKTYIDENVTILFSYPEFAQKLLSMYYKFTLTEYKKFQNKIVIGECYSYPTGTIDRIFYSPGIIFNKEIGFKVDAGHQEFTIPLDKKAVSGITDSIHFCHVLDSYREYPHLYHQINGALKENTKAIKQTFAQKLDSTFEPAKIRKLIEGNIDLIIEEYFWLNNFAPYINKAIAGKLFDSFDIVMAKRSFDDYLPF